MSLLTSWIQIETSIFNCFFLIINTYKYKCFLSVLDDAMQLIEILNVLLERNVVKLCNCTVYYTDILLK